MRILKVLLVIPPTLATRPSAPSSDDRQLCITLTQLVSLLLDTSRACRVAKSLKSQKKSARWPNVFQDRCRQPLGYLSAQWNQALGAYLGTDVSSNFCLVSSKSSRRTRNTKGPLAPDFPEAR
jgi:hypothetical protein